MVVVKFGALLCLLVVAGHNSGEHDGAREVEKFPVAEEAEVAVFALDEAERLHALGVWRVGIGQASAVVVVVLVVSSRILVCLFAEREIGYKVGRIPGLGYFAATVEFPLRHGEVLVDCTRDGIAFYEIFFLLSGSVVHGIAQLHVGVKRIVFRCGAFHGVGVVDRRVELGFLWHETVQIAFDSYIVFLVFV